MEAGANTEKSSNIRVITIFATFYIAMILFFWFLASNKENFSINSFEECIAAGYTARGNYPEFCVLKTGKSFVNPGQKLFLNISEWNVRLDLFGKDKDASYTLDKNDLDRIILSSKRLNDFADSHKECMVANKQVVLARTEKDIPNSKRINGFYYYQIKSKIAPCISSRIADIQKLNKEAYNLQWQLPSYKTIEQIPAP